MRRDVWDREVAAVEKRFTPALQSVCGSGGVDSSIVHALATYTVAMWCSPNYAQENPNFDTLLVRYYQVYVTRLVFDSFTRR
jgi:asparagine synthetase B (glutamine-hydrolysing)